MNATTKSSLSSWIGLKSSSSNGSLLLNATPHRIGMMKQIVDMLFQQFVVVVVVADSDTNAATISTSPKVASQETKTTVPLNKKQLFYDLVTTNTVTLRNLQWNTPTDDASITIDTFKITTESAKTTITITGIHCNFAVVGTPTSTNMNSSTTKQQQYSADACVENEETIIFMNAVEELLNKNDSTTWQRWKKNRLWNKDTTTKREEAQQHQETTWFEKLLSLCNNNTTILLKVHTVHVTFRNTNVQQQQQQQHTSYEFSLEHGRLELLPTTTTNDAAVDGKENPNNETMISSTISFENFTILQQKRMNIGKDISRILLEPWTSSYDMGMTTHHHQIQLRRQNNITDTVTFHLLEEEEEIFSDCITHSIVLLQKNLLKQQRNTSIQQQQRTHKQQQQCYSIELPQIKLIISENRVVVVDPSILQYEFDLTTSSVEQYWVVPQHSNDIRNNSNNTSTKLPRYQQNSSDSKLKFAGIHYSTKTDAATAPATILTAESDRDPTTFRRKPLLLFQNNCGWKIEWTTTSTDTTKTIPEILLLTVGPASGATSPNGIVSNEPSSVETTARPSPSFSTDDDAIAASAPLVMKMYCEETINTFQSLLSSIRSDHSSLHSLCNSVIAMLFAEETQRHYQYDSVLWKESSDSSRKRSSSAVMSSFPTTTLHMNGLVRFMDVSSDVFSIALQKQQHSKEDITRMNEITAANSEKNSSSLMDVELKDLSLDFFSDGSLRCGSIQGGKLQTNCTSGGSTVCIVDFPTTSYFSSCTNHICLKNVLRISVQGPDVTSSSSVVEKFLHDNVLPALFPAASSSTFTDNIGSNNDTTSVVAVDLTKIMMENIGSLQADRVCCYFDNGKQIASTTCIILEDIEITKICNTTRISCDHVSLTDKYNNISTTLSNVSYKSNVIQIGSIMDFTYNRNFRLANPSSGGISLTRSDHGVDIDIPPLAIVCVIPSYCSNEKEKEESMLLEIRLSSIYCSMSQKGTTVSVVARDKIKSVLILPDHCHGHDAWIDLEFADASGVFDMWNLQKLSLHDISMQQSSFNDEFLIRIPHVVVDQKNITLSSTASCTVDSFNVLHNLYGFATEIKDRLSTVYDTSYLLQMVICHGIAVDEIIIQNSENNTRCRMSEVIIADNAKAIKCEHMSTSYCNGSITMSFANIYGDARSRRCEVLSIESLYIKNFCAIVNPTTCVTLQMTTDGRISVELHSIELFLLETSTSSSQCFVQDIIPVVASHGFDLSIPVVTFVGRGSSQRQPFTTTCCDFHTKINLNSSGIVNFYFFVKTLDRPMITCKNICFTGTWNGQHKTNSVHNLNFDTELVSVAASFSVADLARLIYNCEVGMGTEWLLPDCIIQSIAIVITVDGANLVKTGSTVQVPSFSGEADCTSSDVVRHLLKSILGTKGLSSFYCNTKIMGESVADLTAKAAGRIAGSSFPLSTIGSIGALVITDSLRNTLAMGKSARGAKYYEEHRPTDVIVGLYCVIKKTAGAGGRLRRGRNYCNYQFGDFGTGVYEIVGTYIADNKSRFGSAGGSVLGMAVGGCIYGFFGVVAGNYVGGKVGSRIGERALSENEDEKDQEVVGATLSDDLGNRIVESCDEDWVIYDIGHITKRED